MSITTANIGDAAFMVTPQPITLDWVQWTFFGWLGVAAAIVLSNVGAAYGTAKAGVGIASIAVIKPDLVYKSLVPVVMSGILGIYGLIVSVILIARVTPSQSDPYGMFKVMTAGNCVGWSGMAAGYAIGIVGDAGVRANAMNQGMFVAMILMMIFAEAIALYGLIVSIIMS